MSIPLERLEGKYEILEKIKEGGMGAIYKVRHRLLEEVRVIKVIRPQLQKDEALRARFIREARNAIRLRHSNIAQLYDFTMDEDGNAFIVMEYIEGLTLDELLRRHGPVPIGLALEVAVQALEALSYLHKKGLVHRDVSPDNLMLSREEDGSPLVKLIDLGLAKGLQDESGLTVQGTFLGKVRYASPEQLRTSEGIKLDQRSDLYSFGVVLYQLLTGVLPIRGESLTPLIAGHLFDSPVPFEESDKDGKVPPQLREALLRCLDKSPDQRYQEAADLAAVLIALQDDFPVLPADVRAAFVSPTDATARIPIVRPGSTQARLDREFEAMATPPPPNGETLAETIGSDSLRPAATAGGDVAARAAELVVEAGREAAQQHLDSARRLAAKALEIQPENSKAGRLLEELEASTGRSGPVRDVKAGGAGRAESLVLEARILAEVGDWKGAKAHLERAAEVAPESSQVTRLLSEARAKAGKVPPPGESVIEPEPPAAARWVAEVETALASGDFDAAEARLQAGLAELGGNEELAALSRKIEKARDKARQEQIRSLLSRARAEVEAGRYDEGISLLEKALEVAPEDTIIKRVLVRTRDERAQRAEEQAREQAAALALAQAEALLEEGELDEADARLDAAIAQVGEREELIAVRSKIAGARTQAEQRDALAAALTSARSALDSGDLATAQTAIADARALAGTDEAVTSLWQEIDARVRAEETRRRSVAVAEAVRRISEAMDTNDVGEAGRALAVAEKLFAGDEQLVELRRRVDGVLRRRRRESVETLAAEANAVSDLAGIEKAVAKVQAALLEDPDSPELAELLDALRERQAQSAVETCLANGDLPAARHALEVAERMFPDSGTILILRRKVDLAESKK